MAFAAARMIMPKDKQTRKASAEMPGMNKNRSKQLNLRQSRSPSIVSARSGLSHDSYKNKQGPPPHPYVPRSASGRPGGKPPTSRGCVKRTKGKGKKGKKGCRDTYDLIVNIDLTEWQLTDEQVAEFKEVFMLFDKDEDGVLTFPELNVVMKSLGQRPTEKDLLTMVRDVSEDHIYDTIEFNEFLQMMSKQQKFGMTEDSLKDAFRIFDKDDDGFISVDELRHIMQSLGEKMNDSELDEMIAEADSDNDGLINYEEFVQVLCSDGKSKGAKKKKKHRKKDSVDLPTTTTTVVVVEDDCNNRLAVDKRSTSSSALASAPKLGPPPPGHATSSVSSQPKNGTASSAISAPSTPVTPFIPPLTSGLIPSMTTATTTTTTPAKLPQTLPNKSKPPTTVPQKTVPTQILTTPQKMMIQQQQQQQLQQKPVSMPSPPKSVTSQKSVTLQKPASTSKVTPTAPKCVTMKPSSNGTTTPVPVTLTTSTSKADMIVMEKSKTTSTVKDNGRKK